MNNLSSQDVRDITGLTRDELIGWCNRGVVTPSGGEGPGNHKQFTLMQIVAITYANWWRKSGMGMETVKGVVDAVLAFTEDELIGNIAEGRVIAIPTNGMNEWKFIAPPEEVQIAEILNIGCVYSQVKRDIAAIAKRLNNEPRNGPGRVRGLQAKKQPV